MTFGTYPNLPQQSLGLALPLKSPPLYPSLHKIRSPHKLVSPVTESSEMDYPRKKKWRLASAILTYTLISAILSRQEVARVRFDHPNDPEAMKKERVKGKVKVTRAFGAAFLKKATFFGLLVSTCNVSGEPSPVICKPQTTTCEP